MVGPSVSASHRVKYRPPTLRSEVHAPSVVLCPPGPTLRPAPRPGSGVVGGPRPGRERRHRVKGVDVSSRSRALFTRGQAGSPVGALRTTT